MCTYGKDYLVYRATGNYAINLVKKCNCFKIKHTNTHSIKPNTLIFKSLSVFSFKASLAVYFL